MEKKTIKNKAVKKKKIDFAKLPQVVDIIALESKFMLKNRVYRVTKQSANSI